MLYLKAANMSENNIVALIKHNDIFIKYVPYTYLPNHYITVTQF